MIAHAVSAADAPSSLGRLGTSGTTRVCISDTEMPPKASTGTTTFVRAGGASSGRRGALRAWVMVLRSRSIPTFKAGD
ncbi:hypothetical protein GCM10020366_28290 [Saccharopolyspora gregorii]|uniref:Uncharacterized protein n=1 Tax=Saccharopolyspora gregorii TaxID=33914 RepID=A0ABP6RQN7_9PSEU